MTTSVHYIVDDIGNKVSVIVPFKEWENLQSKYQMLLNKIDVLNGIQESMIEIKLAKQAGTKLQTLNQFLDEYRN